MAIAGPDDDLLIEPMVSYQGRPLPLVLDVFFEEGSPPELAVLAPAPLLTLVVEQIRASLGARDVRVLRAEGQA